jgi:transposase
MPKPYSLDLRERVVRFVDEGHSRHAAAAHFKVSVSFVVNLVKAFHVRGSLACPQALPPSLAPKPCPQALPPKPSGERRHAKLEPHRAFLLQKVAEKADITMPELAAELAASSPPARRPIPPRFHVGSSASAIASRKLCGPASMIGPT